MSKSILIIDDEKSIQQSLSGALKDEGYQITTASDGLEGIEKVKSIRPDVILLDIWMPKLDGIETLKKIRTDYPDQCVIMMSGHGTIETAVTATKLGAYDFIEKPLSLEKLLVLLQNALGHQDLARENSALRKQVKKKRALVGESPAILKIKDLIKRVAPTTGSVLITGENGTGKEVVAHSIFTQSTRFNRPFVEVNCAAIPEELIESELFGHERGAFTGATQMRRGKFDLANGGTLFLDEIGDMSMKTQAKILRILQEQKFERVGGTATITVDVRIIAATNKDLQEEIQAGNFREDLFYRLNVVPFLVPSLRERLNDIPLLANHFIAEHAATHSKKSRKLNEEAIATLKGYTWPGNVRELRNLMERIIILTSEAEEGRDITPADLLLHLESEMLQKKTQPVETSESSKLTGVEAVTQATNLRDARSEFEKEFIIKTLKEQGGNVSKTAAILGIERSHLHRKIKSYGIDVSSEKDRD